MPCTGGGAWSPLLGRAPGRHRHRPARSEAELVDGGVQLVDAAVDAERAGPEQLVLAVAAREDADAEHPCSARREEIPHRIAHDVTVPDLDADPFLAGEEG